MREGGSMLSFAAEADVGYQTLLDWRHAHPEFDDATQRAKAQCAAWWERLARANARSGAGNATLTMFGLSNMARDMWRKEDHVDHTSSDGSMSPTTINLVGKHDG